MKNIVLCSIIFSCLCFFQYNLYSEDFVNHFWKWSNQMPSLPVISGNNKIIEMTSDSITAPQLSFAMYGIPVFLKDDFTVEFTLQFSSTSSGETGADGISFNIWGMDVNSCSLSLPIGLSPYEMPNMDSIGNYVIWNYSYLSFLRLKYLGSCGPLITGGHLGVYNYSDSTKFCNMRPAISFEFDTYYNTNNSRICGNNNDLRLDWMLQTDHFSITALGNPNRKYLNDTIIAQKYNFEDGNEYKIHIDWSYVNKQFSIAATHLPTMITTYHVSQTINFEDILNELNINNTDLLSFIGFTATTGTSRNTQKIKNFSYSSKYKVPQGGF